MESSDFLNKMALAVKIRQAIEISNLEAHIAYSAGEPKSGPVMTGARAVIDILRSSGLIREEEDKIVPGEPISIRKTPEETVSIPLTPPTSPPQLRQSNINLNIELRIDVKPSELEGLAEKLKDLLKSLSEIHEENQTS